MTHFELPIGHDVDTDIAFSLDGARFNRHTFWCGQSGSGKTYALGVVLEQLLLRTGLPILVFDPNSDFVHLGNPQEAAPKELADQLASREVRVFRPRAPGDERLSVRFVDMDLPSRAAVLRLDPIDDADEFHLLRKMEAEHGRQDAAALIEALADSEQVESQKLLRRIQNLGVLDWDAWAFGDAGVESAVQQRADATVLDLAGFFYSDEPSAVALAVLDRIWASREQREPLLIVIDEAHNLCPAEPTSPVQRKLCERLIQIAAEGRKYGLWLLLSTQRPSKIHPQVLSQCDNLCLMRMNAPADLKQLGEYFGAVPRDLLERAPHFAKGQALFAGGFVGKPTVNQMALRLTREGGGDVAVPARFA